MSFPLDQEICTACITVTQLVHIKTASYLAAPMKNIMIIIDKFKFETKLQKTPEP